MGNRNDARSTWNHWRGEIDTAPPRRSSVTLSGQGQRQDDVRGLGGGRQPRQRASQLAGPAPPGDDAGGRRHPHGDHRHRRRPAGGRGPQGVRRERTLRRGVRAAPPHWSDDRSAIMRADLDLTNAVTVRAPYTDTHGSGFVEDRSRSRTELAHPRRLCPGLSRAAPLWSYQGETGGKASTASSAPAWRVAWSRPSPR